MTIPAPLRRTWGVLSPAPVRWPVVLLLAAAMAFADSFILTTLEGAVAAPDVDSPFTRWLWTSALVLPVFVLAVLGALAFARSRFGPALRTTRKVLGAALLVAVAGGLAGTAHAAATLTYDYHVQSEQHQATISAHQHATGGGNPAITGDTTHAAAAQEEQLSVILRAVRLGSGLDLGINVLLVCWLLAARGGHLEPRRRRAVQPTARPIVPIGEPIGEPVAQPV